MKIYEVRVESSDHRELLETAGPFLYSQRANNVCRELVNVYKNEDVSVFIYTMLLDENEE